MSTYYGETRHTMEVYYRNHRYPPCYRTKEQAFVHNVVGDIGDEEEDDHQ